MYKASTGEYKILLRIGALQSAMFNLSQTTTSIQFIYVW